MSSLAAKARYAKIGGRVGTAVVTPPPNTTPDDTVPQFVVEPTTARVAAATDNNKIIEFTNVSDSTYTIKAYSDVPLPIGAILIAQQGSTGQVTFVPDAGVTFETSDSYKTRAQESFVAMKHASLNQWKALGDLEASIAALSVLGRAVNSVGGAVAIASSADLQVLFRRANALMFDLIGMSDVTGLVAALALKAPLESPPLTGTPTAPTAAPGNNTTQISTTAFVQAAIAALIDASPGALDTLNELAAALGDDPNFATTITNALALKASIVQVQQDTLKFAVAAGTADAMTATLTPAPTLVNGMRVYIRAIGANTTTNPTLALNGGTAVVIRKFGGSPLAAGDIVAAGHELTLSFAETGPVDYYELLNPNATAGGGASVIDSIADGDTTNAPSRNSVFDALALKAADAAVVHLAGSETVSGFKTFSDANGVWSTGAGGFRATGGQIVIDRDGDGAAAQRQNRVDSGFAATDVAYVDALAAWQWGANASGNWFLNAIDASAVTRQVAQISRATATWDWKIEPTLNGLKMANMSILDAGGYFTTDTVESALQQLGSVLAYKTNFYGGTTSTGNVGAGDDTLQTYTLPANTLTTNGERVTFRASGSVANNANAKQIRVKFGATVLFASGALPTSSAFDWAIEGEIVRRSATSQVAHVTFTTSNATIPVKVDSVLPTETLSSALAIAITGEAVSNNDIVCEALTVTGSGAALPLTGTVNPATPFNGQQFFRTDLGLDIYYDGTRWLTKNEYEFQWTDVEGVQPASATNGSVPRAPVPDDWGIYLTKFVFKVHITTTNSGTAYWNFDLIPVNVSNVALATLRSATTQSLAADTWHNLGGAALNSVLDANAKTLRITPTEVLSPGVARFLPTLMYRKIIT